MKKFIKISLVIATVLLMATSVFANDFQLKTGTENQKTISILIEGEKDVDLSIHSVVDNELIYEQKIYAKQAITKTYNLDALPDANYTVKLEAGTKLTTYQIAIVANKVISQPVVVTDMVKPVLTKDKDIVTLNLGENYKGSVEIHIYNEFNEELYGEKFKNSSIKKFDTSKTYSKELTFVVTYNDHEFVKTIDAR